MYNSLHSFYSSSEWENTRMRLMLERGMICEYCHKLIINKFDAIGHHINELSMLNVNDPNVSLNLDNLMLVHRDCHNAIHNRCGHYTQHRYLVYGSPLSGKTTYVNKIATKDDLVISLDDIRFAITGGHYHQNSNNTNTEVFAVRDFLIDRVKARGNRMKFHNLYLVGGYPLKSERERLCRELKLEEVFIDVSKEECLIRLEAATDGRDKVLWKQYIDKWFNDYRA